MSVNAVSTKWLGRALGALRCALFLLLCENAFTPFDVARSAPSLCSAAPTKQNGIFHRVPTATDMRVFGGVEPGVICGRHGEEMFGVNTSPVSTGVMDFVPFRYRAPDGFVGCSVSIHTADLNISDGALPTMVDAVVDWHLANVAPCPESR